MARVTVEDCVKNIPNRFGLVLVAANRAKKISRGAPSEMQPESNRANSPDKPPVRALRELADSQETATNLESDLITSFQKVHLETEEPEEFRQELEPDQEWSEQIAQLSRELESLGTVDENESADLEQVDPAEIDPQDLKEDTNNND